MSMGLLTKERDKDRDAFFVKLRIRRASLYAPKISSHFDWF